MASTQAAAEQPAGCCASTCHCSAAAAPKLDTAYHLMTQREQLQTPLLHSPSALIALRGTALVREAWTDIGIVGAGRRADLTRGETFRQILPT